MPPTTFIGVFILLALPSTSAEHMYISSLIKSTDLSDSINTYAGVPSICINLLLSGTEVAVFTAQDVIKNNENIMLNLMMIIPTQ